MFYYFLKYRFDSISLSISDVELEESASLVHAVCTGVDSLCHVHSLAQPHR